MITHGRKTFNLLLIPTLIFVQLGITACASGAGHTYAAAVETGKTMEETPETPGGTPTASREASPTAGQTPFSSSQTGEAVSYDAAASSNTNDNYDPEDVKAINAMIDNNSLTATKDAPASWDFAQWDTATAPKRIDSLILDNKGLTGKLDVTGLTGLKSLSCFDNQLEALDLSGLTGLKDLYCFDNQLQALNIADLTNLEALACARNQLKAFDVSGLTKLALLDISNNPCQSLKTDSGSLTLSSGAGGDAAINGIIMQDSDADKKNTVFLNAVPDASHIFKDWSGLPEDTPNTPSTSFVLSGNVNVNPSFDAPTQTGSSQ